MDKHLLVINTLVFLEQQKAGVLQSEMLDVISQLGIKKAEIRREFIKDLSTELIDINRKALELNMELFYSVPDMLYRDGELQYENIETYFKEAHVMSCPNVKMNIGNYTSVTSNDVNRLNKLCDQYSINLRVENDQSEADGKVSKIKTFTDQYRQLGGNISVTFDTGNWVWQKEDSIENAKMLKDYVTYIHLKDVTGKEKPQTVLLNEGDIAWKSILDVLPKDVPVALEYPCGKDATKQLSKELEKLLEPNASKL